MSARATSGFLLQGAIAYCLDIVGGLDVDSLPRPSPCPGWDVHALVTHLNDGFGVLAGARATGRCPPGPSPPGPAPGPPDPVAAFSSAACDLLTVLTALPERAPHRFVAVADAAVAIDVAVVTGAVEIAVHGWDVAAACGHPRPIPPILAVDMLALVPLLVPPGARPGMFAEPVAVPSQAPPGDRLLAFLGRSPAHHAVPVDRPTTGPQPHPHADPPRGAPRVRT